MRYKGDKGKAWEECRLYICERDDWKCSTCHRTRESGFVMNAGHYQPVGLVGSNNRLSWDEMNIHCQCTVCNNQGQGEQEKMGRYISSKYGEDVRKDLEERRYKMDKFTNWKEIKEYYKNKRKQLNETR